MHLQIALRYMAVIKNLLYERGQGDVVASMEVTFAYKSIIREDYQESGVGNVAVMQEQKLRPGEKIDMPVFFYLDPEFATDPRMKKVNHLTLSYTFFKVGRPVSSPPVRATCTLPLLFTHLVPTCIPHMHAVACMVRSTDFDQCTRRRPSEDLFDSHVICAAASLDPSAGCMSQYVLSTSSALALNFCCRIRL